MGRVAVVAVALVACAAAATGSDAAPERYVSFTPLLNNSWGVSQWEQYPAHKPAYLVVSRAGADKLSALGVMRGADSDVVQAMDFRRSVAVGVFLYFPFPRFCPQGVAIRRVRVHERRVDVTATVEMRRENSCNGVPELAGLSFYDVVVIPRRFMPDGSRMRHVFVRYVPPS